MPVTYSCLYPPWSDAAGPHPWATFDFAVAIYDDRNGETHIVSHLGFAVLQAIAAGCGDISAIEQAVRADFDIDEAEPGASLPEALAAALKDLLRARLIRSLHA